MSFGFESDHLDENCGLEIDIFIRTLIFLFCIFQATGIEVKKKRICDVKKWILVMIIEAS